MPTEVFDASDIAAELRRRRPGIGTKKLHKLLYLCQAHHLADTHRKLFAGSIAAWEMGPVVGRLWKHEQAHGPVREGRKLDQAALNTVGYVLSRYGALTGRDLEILTHGQSPWIDARARGHANADPSPKIHLAELTAYFRESFDRDDDDLPVPDAALLDDALRGAATRLSEVRRPDDLDRLRTRVSELSAARAR